MVATVHEIVQAIERQLFFAMMVDLHLLPGALAMLLMLGAGPLLVHFIINAFAGISMFNLILSMT